MKVLLVIPPMTQLNTPYPSTAYLKSYLDSKNIDCDQKDFGIDVIDELFSKKGLQQIYDLIISKPTLLNDDSVAFFLDAFSDYKSTVEPVKAFLRGNDTSLALRLASRKLVPEGPRFLPLNEHKQLLDIFGDMATHDRAKYIASLYFDDIADIIKKTVDDKFEFSRYGEKLASSQTSFSALNEEIESSNTIIDQMLYAITKNYIDSYQPDIIALTAPFPGNVYGAFKIAKFAKAVNPNVKIVMGGGYVNTELRTLNDKRFFTYIDYLIFDDGERALECVIEHLSKKRQEDQLLRTWFLKEGEIMKVSSANEKDVAFKSLSAPTYKGLQLDKYISMIEMPNPVHRMWSDYRWNKLILAHGCYWKKCTFCDVTLDYIERFEPQKAIQIVDNMELMMKETGQSGFHFVDEASPPAILKQMSEEIIDRKLQVSYWGNIRFDTMFTKDVCTLMADAGCIAVTGGLEVASPRLLELIKKGVTIEQVAHVTKAFKDAGIYVHAYLMYGFPTQTTQETVDSLEVVRQLFENGCIDSAFWHRFVATVHSPVGKMPENFKIKTHYPQIPKEGLFAINEIPFTDPTPCDHDEMGKALRFALYNYMHNLCLDISVDEWFEIEVPKTTLSADYIKNILMQPAPKDSLAQVYANLRS